MNVKRILMVTILIIAITTAMVTAIATAAEPQEEVILSESGTGNNTYTFELTKPGRVYFNVQITGTADVSRTITLYDCGSRGGRTIHRWHASSGAVRRSVDFFLDSGEYTVEINAISFNFTITGNYTENVGQFEIEPNNERNTASPMRVNQPISGNLFNNSDIDWFVFSVDTAGEAFISLQHPRNVGRWRVTFFDNSDNQLAQFTTPRDGTHTNSDGIFINAGTYRVRVDRVDHSTEIYTLRVVFDDTVTPPPITTTAPPITTTPPPITTTAPTITTTRTNPTPAPVIYIFTTADALNILRSVAGTLTLTAEQRTLYDLNRDGTVTTADALHVLRIVAGL